MMKRDKSKSRAVESAHRADRFPELSAEPESRTAGNNAYKPLDCSSKGSLLNLMHFDSVRKAPGGDFGDANP